MKLKGLLFALTSLLWMSCTTDVTLCEYTDEHAHRSELNVVYDWGKYIDLVKESRNLDSITLLAWRKSYQLKYVYQLTSLPGETGSVMGRLLQCSDWKEWTALQLEKQPAENTPSEEEPVPEEGEETPPTEEEPLPEGGEDIPSVDEDTGGSEDVPVVMSANANDNEVQQPERTKLGLRGGDYEVMAYTGSSDAFEQTISDGFLGEYGTFDIIKLVYKEYKLSQEDESVMMPDFEKYVNWTDMNPYSGYVLGTIDPIFCAHASLSVPMSKNGKVTLRLTPKPITQHVRIEFNIKRLEKGVQVDSIQAELAGVASAIYVADRSLEIDKTYKVFFSPTFPKDAAANRDCTPLATVGELDITGLVSSRDPGVHMGPGVMHVNIFTKVEVENETGLGSRLVRRVFKAAINLHHLLRSNPSIVIDSETGKYLQSSPSLTLRINAPLEITRERVEEAKDANIDYWIECERVDVEM